MSSIHSVSRTTYVLWVLGLSLLLASPTFAPPAEMQRAASNEGAFRG